MSEQVKTPHLEVERFEVLHSDAMDYGVGWNDEPVDWPEEYKIRFWLDGQKYAMRLSAEAFEALKVAPGEVIPTFRKEES